MIRRIHVVVPLLLHRIHFEREILWYISAEYRHARTKTILVDQQKLLDWRHSFDVYQRVEQLDHRTMTMQLKSIDLGHRTENVVVRVFPKINLWYLDVRKCKFDDQFEISLHYIEFVLSVRREHFQRIIPDANSIRNILLKKPICRDSNGVVRQQIDFQRIYRSPPSNEIQSMLVPDTFHLMYRFHRFVRTLNERRLSLLDSPDSTTNHANFQLFSEKLIKENEDLSHVQSIFTC